MQIRNPDDPMRQREITCFASVIGCDESQVRVGDLLRETPSRRQEKAPTDFGRFASDPSGKQALVCFLLGVSGYGTCDRC